MAPMTDFSQQTVGVNAIDAETILQQMRIVCYDQPIYEDMRLEGDEWLGLTLGVDRASVATTVRLMYDQAAILIQDNDSKLLNMTTAVHINFRVVQSTLLPHGAHAHSGVKQSVGLSLSVSQSVSRQRNIEMSAIRVIYGIHRQR